MTAAGSTLALGLYEDSKSLLFFGVFLALTPLILKASGILYSAALLGPLFFIIVSERAPRLTIGFLAISSITLVLLAHNGFDVTVQGEQYTLSWGDVDKIRFAGYRWNFEVFPLRLILFNQLWAFLVNQSYSMVMLIGFCGFLILFKRYLYSASEYRSLKFIALAPLSLVLAFMLPQLVTVYAERFTVPGRDLGNSRFMLGFAPLILLSVSFWPELFEPAER